jgi:hypothetical protein
MSAAMIAQRMSRLRRDAAARGDQAPTRQTSSGSSTARNIEASQPGPKPTMPSGRDVADVARRLELRPIRCRTAGPRAHVDRYADAVGCVKPSPAHSSGHPWMPDSSPRPRRSGGGGDPFDATAQGSTPGGSTYLRGGDEPTPPLSLRRALCRPCVATTDAAVSGCPSWAAIHAKIAAESGPAAMIAARSMTAPPEWCGRDRRATNMRIVSSSIDQRLVLSRENPSGFAVGGAHRARHAPTEVASLAREVGAASVRGALQRRRDDLVKATTSDVSPSR